jgi:hypothetical protein
MGEDNRGNDLGNLIRIDDERVREHLGHIVRGTVEETLNALLEARVPCWLLWAAGGADVEGPRPKAP